MLQPPDKIPRRQSLQAYEMTITRLKVDTGLVSVRCAFPRESGTPDLIEFDVTADFTPDTPFDEIQHRVIAIAIKHLAKLLPEDRLADILPK